MLMGVLSKESKAHIEIFDQLKGRREEDFMETENEDVSTR